MTGLDRLILALAALAGGLGVAASAAAAHGAGTDALKIAAQFLLFHAPSILALVGLGGAGLTHRLGTRIAAGLLLLGLVLFSGDLSLRALAAQPLFPMAAPLGGTALMLGWLMAAVAVLIPPRR